MKHVTLSILSILSFSMSLISQVVTSDWAPSPYLGILRNHVQNVTGVSPGSAGSVQTWDFSSLSSDSTSILEFVNPTELDGFTDFPDATVGYNLFFNGQAVASVFFESSASAYRVLGTNPESPVTTLIYTNPMDIMRFPVGFGQTFSDSFNIEISGSFSYEQRGENVAEVDGSGTLITPAGTFNNVLRMKSIETTQSVGLPPTPGGPTISETTSYLFFSSEFPSVPLLEYRISGDNINSNSDTTISYGDPSYLSITEKETNNFSIYPNPANNQITISTTTSLQRVELLDLFGRVVIVEPNQNNTKAIINTSTVKSGVYMVRGILMTGKTFVKKVSIVH